MAATLDEITPELREWIAAQHIFFVATAPLASDGHVNLSPKGLDTFRVLGPRRVAYLDLTGSGVETIAHLRENGRITLMLTAFTGPPRILRLQGQGEAHVVGTPGFAALAPSLPSREGTRAIITIEVTRIATSCGFSVPRYEFVAERDQLDRWAANKGPEGVIAYRQEKNARSIDGLPAL
jgi:hypothetical protein